jgi:hypothetical protein
LVGDVDVEVDPGSGWCGGEDDIVVAVVVVMAAGLLVAVAVVVVAVCWNPTPGAAWTRSEGSVGMEGSVEMEGREWICGGREDDEMEGMEKLVSAVAFVQCEQGHGAATCGSEKMT